MRADDARVWGLVWLAICVRLYRRILGDARCAAARWCDLGVMPACSDMMRSRQVLVAPAGENGDRFAIFSKKATYGRGMLGRGNLIILAGSDWRIPYCVSL